MERELSRARQHLEQTRREIELLQTDEAYLEVLSHRELGTLRPDEIEIRFVSADLQRPGAKNE